MMTANEEVQLEERKEAWRRGYNEGFTSGLEDALATIESYPILVALQKLEQTAQGRK